MFDKIYEIVKIGIGVITDPTLAPIVDEVVGRPTIIKVPIPGYNRDAVKVTQKGGKLVVNLNDNHFATYNIPAGTNTDKIKIVVVDGVLSIDFAGAQNTETEIIID